LVFTFPNPNVKPLVKFDVSVDNGDRPDGIKFDKTKLNVELVCGVARRKTSTISVSESTDNEEFNVDEFANIIYQRIIHKKKSSKSYKLHYKSFQDLLWLLQKIHLN
jgi:hypothetical protein